MPHRSATKKTQDYLKQRAFQMAFKKTLSVRAAAAAAKIETSQHFGWMKGTDQNARNYQAAWRDLQEECAQALEDEAIRRAYEGVKKTLYYKGRPMRTGRGRNARNAVEVNYSDTLMVMLLKRFRPEQYRERTTTEVTGAVEIVDRLQQARARLIKMQSSEQPDSAAG